LAHLEHVSDYVNEITRRKCRLIEAISLGFSEFDIGLQTANSREIKLSLIEKHSPEEVPRGEDGRRIAGSHLAIDFENRIERSLDRVLFQGLADYNTDIIAFGEDDLDQFDSRLGNLLPFSRCQFGVR